MPNPPPPELSAELKDALVKLGDVANPPAIPGNLVAELLLLDLIEWQGTQIRFTDKGRKLFRELRGKSGSK